LVAKKCGLTPSLRCDDLGACRYSVIDDADEARFLAFGMDAAHDMQRPFAAVVAHFCIASLGKAVPILYVFFLTDTVPRAVLADKRGTLARSDL
jgi:hypothetical protein